MNLGTITIFGIELSWDELITGFVLQLALVRVLGWWVALVAAICGLLWAFGGAAGGNKLFRRIGVPAVAAISLICHGHLVPALIGCGLAIASIWCISYGKNAQAYKYFYKFNGDHKAADYQARTTLYIAYLVSWGIGLLFK